MKVIDKFCLAIEKMEGYYKGSRSYRNKNCGNLRYIGQKLAIGKDKDGFAIFKTYQDGYNTLKMMVYNACAGKSKIYSPTMTIAQFFALFAPASDKNDPNHYAITVANACGLPVTTPIKNLLT